MKRLAKTVAAVLAAACLWTAPADVWAQTSNESKARQLFNGGVEAFKSKDYKTAARAFDEAFEIAQKPALLFSSAQALRREYERTEDATVARAAIQRYERYLDLQKTGGRRVDAKRSLVDLQRLVGAGEGGGSLAQETVVQINSPTKGAVGSLDGGPMQALPFSARIDPGKHEVEVYATGYAPRTETFDISKNEILMFPVALEGKAPELDITGESGAEVIIDGVPMGETPFLRPLELSPGSHLVAVAANGYKPYVEEIDFTYGSQTEVQLDLPMTVQRQAAWGVIATGATIFAGGVVVSALGFVAQAEAAQIDRRLQDEGSISREDAEEYNQLIDDRDRLTGAGSGIAGFGLLVAGTGLLLYLFDEPEIRPPPRKSDDEKETEETKPETPESMDVEVMAAPIVVPGVNGVTQWGMSLQGRF